MGESRETAKGTGLGQLGGYSPSSTGKYMVMEATVVEEVHRVI